MAFELSAAFEFFKGFAFDVHVELERSKPFRHPGVVDEFYACGDHNVAVEVKIAGGGPHFSFSRKNPEPDYRAKRCGHYGAGDETHYRDT